MLLIIVLMMINQFITSNDFTESSPFPQSLAVVFTAVPPCKVRFGWSVQYRHRLSMHRAGIRTILSHTNHTHLMAAANSSSSRMTALRGPVYAPTVSLFDAPCPRLLYEFMPSSSTPSGDSVRTSNRSLTRSCSLRYDGHDTHNKPTALKQAGAAAGCRLSAASPESSTEQTLHSHRSLGEEESRSLVKGRVPDSCQSWVNFGLLSYWI